jgi:iron complex transport system substrate-binding protein
VTRTALYNVLGLVATLAIATWSVARADSVPTTATTPVVIETSSLHFVTLPDGTRALVDRTGHATPLRHYARIVSASTVVDQLLIELCERDRVVAFTAYGAAHHPHPAYAGKATQPGLASLELLIGLKPDLVIANNVQDPKLVQRLREQPFETFDLGELRGVSTLVPDILAVGVLIGKEAEARDYAHRFERRLGRVALDVRASAAKTSLYVSPYGSTLYGGGAGTSYHDVIVAAGLRDVAASRYADWPEYTAEQLLMMDPETVTTTEGGKSKLCGHPGLERLRVCKGEGTVLEMPSDLLGDPGPRILEAAEMLHDLAYAGARSP